MTTRTSFCRLLNLQISRPIVFDHSPLIRAVVASILLHSLFFWLAEDWGGYQNVSLGKHTQLEIRFSEPKKSVSLSSSPIDTASTTDLFGLTQNESASDSSALAKPTSRQSLPKVAKPDKDIEENFVPPVFAVAIEPQYPLQLLINNTRGAVTATFQFGSGGKIEQLEILDSRPPGAFDQAVIDAITRARLPEGSTRPRGRFMITVIFDASGTNTQAQISQYR